MKNIIHILISLLISLLIGFCSVLLFYFTGYYIQSLKLFFIIPVGSIVLGFILSSIIGLSYLITSDKPSLLFFMHTIIASTLLIIFIYLFEMRIDNFSNIVSYLNTLFSNQEISMFYRNYETGINLKSNYIFNVFCFILEIPGYYFGGIIIYSMLNDKQYCELCNKYYKKLPLLSVAGDHLDDVLKTIKTMKIQDAYDLLKYNSGRYKVFGLVKTYIQLTLNYCPICFNSHLFVKDLIIDTNINKTYSTKYYQFELHRNDGRYLYIQKKNAPNN